MTTTSLTDKPTFTVRGPEDLLALAPIMLGFELADDVVLLTFGGPRPFHARVDLPARADLDRAAAEDLADALVDPAHRLRVPAVVALFYSEDDVATLRAWQALRRRCAHHGIEVLDAMRVTEGRYHPLRGDRRLREVGVPVDLTGHRFLAQAVAAGLVVRGSREELAATLAPDTDARAAVASQLVAGGHYDRGLPTRSGAVRDAVAWARGVVADHVADRTNADDQDLARLAWLLQAVPVRDALWAAVERHDAAAHADFWSDVVRRVPAALVAGPAALVAWSAWRAGNGALAWLGVDRCREVDPEDRVAEAVARALERALPPEAAERVRTSAGCASTVD